MLPSPLPRYYIIVGLIETFEVNILISCLLARKRCDQPSFHRVSGRVGFRVCDTCETLSACCTGVVIEYFWGFKGFL